MANLNKTDVSGKSVLEVGSLDVNGSLRGYVESLGPVRYLGVDAAAGIGVDEVCRVEDLVEVYGSEVFDLIISTELIEHVRNWRAAISNLKNATKPNGILLITTRSRGFKFHGYPFDFWRYELADIAAIFCDFTIEVLQPDRRDPGVFLKARKPERFKEANLGSYQLFSVITQARTTQISDRELLEFRIRYIARAAAERTPRSIRRAIVPSAARARIKRLLGIH